VENAVLNFEGQTTSFSITVRSTDNGLRPLSITSVLTVTVTDANDPPTDIVISNFIIEENKPAGTPIGVLSTVDEDGNRDAYVLALRISCAAKPSPASRTAWCPAATIAASV